MSLHGTEKHAGEVDGGDDGILVTFGGEDSRELERRGMAPASQTTLCSLVSRVSKFNCSLLLSDASTAAPSPQLTSLSLFLDHLTAQAMRLRYGSL